MEKVKINPLRLKWCINIVGIDITELSRTLRIAEKTLRSNFITPNQLEKIAEYFDRGLLFFLDPTEPLEEIIYSESLRDFIDQKKV